jgi:hypothetical protein
MRAALGLSAAVLLVLGSLVVYRGAAEAGPLQAAAFSDLRAAGGETLAGHEVVQVRHAGTEESPELVVEVIAEPGVTPGELEHLATAIRDRALQDDDYRMVMVGFNDHAAFIGHGHALGLWTHLSGPDGAAREVAQLRDKDWSQRPSAEHVEVWLRWRDELTASLASDDEHAPAALEVMAWLAG